MHGRGRGIGPGADGTQERLALCQRFQLALARGGGGDRRVVHIFAPMGVRQQDRVIAPGAVAQRVLDPGQQLRGITHLARLYRPFQPVAVREGTDREGRAGP